MPECKRIFQPAPAPAMHARLFMRIAILAAVLAAVAACSPTTDITRTSTEMTAERTPYEVVGSQATDGLLHLQMKVYSRGAAQRVAEDVVVKKRAGFDRIHVDIYGWDEPLHGSPFAVLRWSTKNGFSYTGNR